MKNNVRKLLLAGFVVVMQPVMFLCMTCLRRINRRALKYPYNRELPKPGIGVELKYRDCMNDLFIHWTNLVNNLGTRKWKAPEDILKEKVSFEMRDGASIPAYVISPKGSENETLPVIVDYHGGGFFLTLMDFQLELAAVYAKQLHCRVVIPQYRTALKYPFPVPLYDCFDTLKLVTKDERTDLDKIILLGDSAGGCLAASVAQMCKDEKLVELAGQLLIYPVTDISQEYPSLKEYEFATWTTAANERMWEIYLKGMDTEEIIGASEELLHSIFEGVHVKEPGYAIPMLRKNCEGLPKAFVEVAEMDSLCDQGVAYANRLKEAGVEVFTTKVPGAYHGYDGSVTNPFVKRMLEERIMWMKDIFHIK